jgi:hypothetical protein
MDAASNRDGSVVQIRCIASRDLATPRASVVKIRSIGDGKIGSVVVAGKRRIF